MKYKANVNLSGRRVQAGEVFDGDILEEHVIKILLHLKHITAVKVKKSKEVKADG